MALIEQGVVDREGVGGLASRLGVSERHLRRELVSEVGTGPNQLARTRRVLLARRLLDETSLAVTDIAFASGFTSIRQFNESFRRAFDATPTELRRRPGRSATNRNDDSVVTLTLASRGRLGWKSLHAFLATHVIPGLEVADADRFRRHLPGGWVELTGGPEDRSVVITCSLDDLSELSSLIPTIRLLCDLDSDIDAIGRELMAHPDLAPLLLHDSEPVAVPRLPGAFDRFELAIRAVVGQQISLRAAHTMLGKLLDLVNPGDDTHRSFPTPAELLASPLDELGMVSRRRETIRTVARAVDEGQVDLSIEADPAEAEQALSTLPGIGPWTAGYITMRAFGHPDGWPSSDLVLARRLGLSGRELDARAESWRPWRAYAAMTIWNGPRT